MLLQDLSVTYQQSGIWRGPTSLETMKCYSILQKGKKEDLGSYKPVSFTPVIGKIMEIILEVIEEHSKDNAAISQSQHGFMKGKSCFTMLISFYDKVICLKEEGKAVNVGFLKSILKCILENTVSQSMNLNKMSSTYLDMYRIQRVNYWLKGQAQRVVVNWLVASQ